MKPGYCVYIPIYFVYYNNFNQTNIKVIGIYIVVLYIDVMFSISSTELPTLPTFVDKVSQIAIAIASASASPSEPGVSSGNQTTFHTLREWCSENGLMVHYSKTPSGTFYVLKYDRAKLKDHEYETVGRFRSVVFDSTGHICCIAPPKMLKLSDEMMTLSVNSEGGHLTAEELVEGLMVNLFYNNGTEKWYVSTKSSVGEVSFDHIQEAEAEAQVQAQLQAPAEAGDAGDSTTGATTTGVKLNIQEVLRRRICDILSLLPGGLEAVPKQYCYSFVLQHPKNQIVNVITVPRLYLVAVYEIVRPDAGTTMVGVNAIRLGRDIFSCSFGGTVSHMPSGLTCVADENATTVDATTTPHTVADYCRMYASMETRSVSLPGVVFQDKDTGFCYKKRNPKYESVKKRKGIEQKLLAQYLQLRKDRAIDEYLKYHPQHSRVFNTFRERLHEYTLRLYDSYIEHYVKKNAKSLKEYDRELKTHMYKIHYDIFLATMKEAGVFVTKHTVINYVNSLAAAQQLACLAGAAAAVTPSHPIDGGVGGVSVERRPFQGKRIERSSSASSSRDRPSGTAPSDVRSGFRSARPTRGRSMPTLTIQVPSNDSVGAGPDSVKGSKTLGCVKVHNQFAGLDVD